MSIDLGKEDSIPKNLIRLLGGLIPLVEGFRGSIPLLGGARGGLT